MSTPIDPNGSTAEQRFRNAFERLKCNKPQVLPIGTAVSQNNVAKEAGCDPSALRKTRFPTLVRQIQAYLIEVPQEDASRRHESKQKKKDRLDLKSRLAEVTSQRDYAQSQLVGAHRRIMELVAEKTMLQQKVDRLEPPPTPMQR